MAAQTEIFRKCRDAAVAASGQLLERCIDQAVSALQDAELDRGKTAHGPEVGDAWRELLRVRAEWIERYPRELRMAIESGAVPTEAPKVQPAATRPGGLTLMDEAAVDQSLESTRLSQLLQSMAEQPLAEFDALVSSAMGLEAVQPEQNPLRPEIFARVLRAMMASAEHPASSQSLWTRHMAPPLGRELGELYRRLTTLLKQADVRAASYRVLGGPSGAAPLRAESGHTGQAELAPDAQAKRTGGPGGPGGPGGQGGQGGQGGPGGYGGRGGQPGSAGDAMPAGREAWQRTGSGWADLSQVGLKHELIQEFLFRGSDQAQAPLAPAYYARVATELAELQARPAEEPPPVLDTQAQTLYRELPAVDRPLRPVSTDTPLDRQVWGDYGGSHQRALVRTQLKKEAREVGQVLGLEVVRKLVNEVAQDPRLLAPVRESIVALEPSLLRLAMVQPRFFSDDDHPGRRLVERVAERSFKYNDEFNDAFQAFAASVASCFSALNEREVRDAEPFTSALANLESGWAAQDQEEERKRAEVLEAVRFAEQRQAQADQIAREIGQRPDLDGVPAVVQEFVYGQWALVMAHARLTDTKRQIDPGAYGGVVTDLLWSVKREVTLRQPARLIQMIPGLLARLRAGLASLGQGSQESAAFFHALEQLYRPVLQLRARKRHGDSDSTWSGVEADADLPEPAPRQQPKPGKTPWMGLHELDKAGFQDTLPNEQAGLTELPTEPKASATAPARPATASADAAVSAADPDPDADLSDSDVEQLMAGLQQGCWVDLYSKQRWLRARLAWASTTGTLFMFVSHGGQPHSMTRRICTRLLRQSLLRPVDMHGVVAHAIDAVGRKPAPEFSTA